MIREMIAKAGRVPNRRGAAGPPIGPAFAGLGRFGALGRYGSDVGQAQEQYLHNQGYVYSIIRTIAHRIIGQPIYHARKVTDDDGKKGVNKNYVPGFLKSSSHQLRNFTASPILSVFAQPNDIMVGDTLMFNTIASLELTGKTFWWMRWSMGRQPEIWPLPSHWVTPVHTPNLFAKWVVEPGGGAQKFELPASDVVYFYYPDPSDPLSALAPLTALAKTVMADESLEESQRRTFLNSMAPGLAITIGQAAEDSPTGRETSPVLTRAQRRALKTILKDEYRGVVNNGEPMILDGFIKGVEPIFPSAREMDYLQSGQATKGRLAQGWGVNPISMGEVENANRASSAVADDHLINNVVNPRISMLSQVMSRKLPPFFSRRSDEVVYIQPAASKDIDYELNRDTAMFDRGAKSINEWREGHGMPPLENGDRAYVPQGPDADGGGWENVNVDRDTGKPSGSKGVRRQSRTWVSVKVRDQEGHEHGDDGKFSGNGGGGSGGKKPSPHGSVDDSDKEHAAKAKAFMSKIKEHGKKAAKVAKGLAVRAHQLSIEISWHVMTKNLADDICETSHDYSKIINAKGTNDWLTTHLGVSGGFAAKVSSLVLSYGLTKLKQHISKKRREREEEGKDYELWLKDAGDDDADEIKVNAVFKIVTAFAEEMGCPKDDLPSKADVRKFVKSREEDSEEEEDEDSDDNGPPKKSIAAGWGVKATASHFRRMVNTHRKEIADVLTGTLQALGAQAVSEIRKYRGHDAANAVEHAIDAHHWVKSLQSAVEGVLTEAVKSGAASEYAVNHTAKEARLMVKAGLPGRLLRAVKSVVGKLLDGKTWGRMVRAIADQTKRAVGRAIKGGEDAGDAAAGVLSEPAAVGLNADKAADVEAAAAVNGGRDAAYKNLLSTGKVYARKWVTCRDSRVRDEHRRAHNQIARGEAPFVVGGEECMYPGDPSLSAKNRCRCRCVSISIGG